jgi:predicted pyridoxine 5'-phosphate oxidase superfamily flavin-nucleotide-binding protein
MMTTTLSTLPTWHAGEIALQEQLGVAERMAAIGPRIVRDHMPDQHRAFYAQLPFIVAGSVDSQGDAWATMLAGKPGFISSPDATTLDIAAHADSSDPAQAGLHAGEPVGLLGIEMHTRRRNRMNGVVEPAVNGLRVHVDQSFGNCPRYIKVRDVELVRDPAQPFIEPVEELNVLDEAAASMIRAADTFFVASYADVASRRQVDVSHRGGKPGFVRVDDSGLLTIPDFSGNQFFSTLGNLVMNGKAGLLFVDFATGDMVQMTGDAKVVLDSPDMATFEGAERLWTFRPGRIVRRPGALALRSGDAK